MHFDRGDDFFVQFLAQAGLVGVIGLSYLAELLIAPVHWPSVLLHTFKPSIPDSNALTISVAIIGATVMPHVLFLHSGLTQDRVRPRNEHERARLLKFSNLEVVAGLRQNQLWHKSFGEQEIVERSRRLLRQTAGSQNRRCIVIFCTPAQYFKIGNAGPGAL